MNVKKENNLPNLWQSASKSKHVTRTTTTCQLQTQSKVSASFFFSFIVTEICSDFFLFWVIWVQTWHLKRHSRILKIVDASEGKIEINNVKNMKENMRKTWRYHEKITRKFIEQIIVNIKEIRTRNHKKIKEKIVEQIIKQIIFKKQ